MNKGTLLYEGKAKRLYETDEKHVLFVSYKNDLTAFNGEKKAEEVGKGRLNNLISAHLFQLLQEAGIENHFIKQLSETEQLVQKTEIIPIEVVVRNVAAGSLTKRLGIEEGTELKETIVEYYYKNDDLGDPLITEDHIKLLELATSEMIEEMRTIALDVNTILKNLFKDCQLRLIDFKLEFGVNDENRIILSDEISPDTCRLWDLQTNEKLDKDVFRQDLGNVTDAYEMVWNRLKGAVSS